MFWIDSHCHLADPRIQDQLPEILARAEKAGIRAFLQGGIGPEDWARQEFLAKKYQQVLPCFGLHPYWVADHTEDECDEALDLLAMKLPNAKAIGELGLDFRPSIIKDSFDRQIDCFEKQIEMAKILHKPMVLHVVRAFEETIRIFEFQGVPKAGGMIHSFNGTAKQAEEYLRMGLHLSVGSPLLRADNERLRQALLVIPLERLLLETDSPDQPPPSHEGSLNEPLTLIEVAEEVARIRKISTTDILNLSRQNLVQLFSLNSILSG